MFAFYVCIERLHPIFAFEARLRPENQMAGRKYPGIQLLQTVYVPLQE